MICADAAGVQVLELSGRRDVCKVQDTEFYPHKLVGNAGCGLAVQGCSGVAFVGIFQPAAKMTKAEKLGQGDLCSRVRGFFLSKRKELAYKLTY